MMLMQHQQQRESPSRFIQQGRSSPYTHQEEGGGTQRASRSLQGGHRAQLLLTRGGIFGSCPAQYSTTEVLLLALGVLVVFFNLVIIVYVLVTLRFLFVAHGGVK